MPRMRAHVSRLHRLSLARAQPEHDRPQPRGSLEPEIRIAGDEDRRSSLRRDFIAFHDGFPTELGICVPREYLLSLGKRQ
jgi:hypothetical protein